MIYNIYNVYSNLCYDKAGVPGGLRAGPRVYDIYNHYMKYNNHYIAGVPGGLRAGPRHAVAVGAEAAARGHDAGPRRHHTRPGTLLFRGLIAHNEI